MILHGVRNQIVEIKVLGENPNLTDSDWLRVYLNIKSEIGNWETVDESLMVFEFKELIQWFKDLSQNKEIEYKDLYFTEPNLAFSLIENRNDSKKIRIIFFAEFKPKTAKKDDQIFIDFNLSNGNLAEIASGLEVESKISSF